MSVKSVVIGIIVLTPNSTHFSITKSVLDFFNGEKRTNKSDGTINSFNK